VEWDAADFIEPDLNKIVEVLADPRYNGGYLFITRSQIANDELFAAANGTSGH
jgi:hypothetical protein